MVANFVGHDGHGNEIIFEDIERAYRAVVAHQLPGVSVRTHKTPLGRKDLPRLPISIVTFNQPQIFKVEGSQQFVIIQPGLILIPSTPFYSGRRKRIFCVDTSFFKLFFAIILKLDVINL